MNVFLSSLARICRDRYLEDKLLLAPSRRIAHQWMETLARSMGQVAFNLRPATMASFAVGLAGPEASSRGLSFASDLAIAAVVSRVWDRLRGSGTYLAKLEPTRRLIESLRRTLESLRLAGLKPSDLDPRDFEVEAKGHEIKALLEGYVVELAERHLFDYADALLLAKKRLLRGEGVSAGTLVLLPSDLRLRRLERELLEALPAGQVLELPVDEPGTDAGMPPNDLWRLRWVFSSPPQTPPAEPDGSVSVFTASTPSCEVREVLRRILEEGLRLDEVEVLYTDYETYVPLILETLSWPEVLPDGKRLAAPFGVPATFSEGLPVILSRPARALLAWLRWQEEGYPKSVLVAAFREGLFELEGRDRLGISFAQFAQELAGVSSVAGRERWQEVFDELLADPRLPERRRYALESLRNTIGKLLEISPENSDIKALLSGAMRLLGELVRVADGFDAISRDMLAEKLEEMSALLDAGGVYFDVADWLHGLPLELRAGGSGPRPGMLHVAGIFAGGHSGRRRTFIVGLDDGRLGDSLPQDPLLLDAERWRISHELQDSQRELAERDLALGRLLARLRGRVTFSCSLNDSALERETFPSYLFRAVLKAVPGLNGCTASPVAFAQTEPRPPLDEVDWWLERLLSGAGPRPSPEAVACAFPNLASGMEAERRRDSPEFTVYDGFIPDLPSKFDPFHEGGPIVSASALEKLGRCPFAYFLRHVLGLKEPEERPSEPFRWLGPLESGELLHEVFRRFLEELAAKGEKPDRTRHTERLLGLLEEELERYRREFPPPNEEAFKRDRRQLESAAKIFLVEEERYSKEAEPAFLEASIGLEPVGKGTELDSLEPERIELGDGRTVRAIGRLDRIDRSRKAEECYSIWDYKTGSPSRYERARQKDPFDGGRLVQPALYLALAEARLKRLSPRARVTLFGYFFPSIRGKGERISFTTGELKGGFRVIERLCELASRGGYIQTDKPQEDCAYCAFRIVCGDEKRCGSRSERKLAEEGNEVLRPFRELRNAGADKR